MLIRCGDEGGVLGDPHGGSDGLWNVGVGDGAADAFIAGLAEKFPNEAWLGTVAAEQFRKPVHTLTTRYAMKDTAALHEAAAKLAPALSGAELLALCRAFITYYTRLVRRLFDLLPIHELAAVFEGANLMAARQKTSVTGRGVEG